MATCTIAAAPTTSTSNVASYATGAFTPVALDLLLVFVLVTGNNIAGATVTDSQNLGWTLVNVAAKAVNADRLWCFVSNHFAAASSMTVTFTTGSGTATGASIAVYRIASMTRVGPDSIRQSAIVSGGAAAGTPAPAFTASALTGNPTLGSVGNATNPATVTPPASWTEDADVGFATPTAGHEVVHRDSGFTGTTVTWGSTSATAFCALIVELNSASAVETYTPTEYDQTGLGMSCSPPGFDTTAKQGLLSLMVIEGNYGDNVEIPPSLNVVSDKILMSYSGYRIPVSMMFDPVDRSMLPIIAAVVINMDWTELTQIPTIDSFYKDHISDETVELITLPQLGSDTILMGWSGYRIPKSSMVDGNDESHFPIVTSQVVLQFWDNDSDQQIYTDKGYAYTMQNLTEFGDINDYPLIPIIVQLTDAENQITNDSWFRSDTLSDDGVENILIPLRDLTLYEDQQLQQQPFNIDRELSDSAVENILIPVVGYDNDSDNQIPNPQYTTDRDLSDTNVENIIIPLLNYVTDADQQFLNPLSFNKDTLSDEGVEQIVLPAIITTYTYDDHGENSIPNPVYYKDHLLDEGTEIIILPRPAWDNDSDNQKAIPLSFGQDTLLDEGVEYITLPFNDWTLDAEQQRQHDPYNVDRELSDPGLEYITLPANNWDNTGENQFRQEEFRTDLGTQDINFPYIIIPSIIQLTDADYQMLQTEYYKDHLMDEEVELITIPPVVSLLYAYDTDAENQLSNAVNYSWMQDPDDRVMQIFIPIQDLTPVSDNQLPSQVGFSSDTLSDETVETIITPVINYLYAQDDDQEISNQTNYAWIDDPTDRGVRIFIPIQDLTPVEDNQLSRQVQFSSDTVSDENVEFITVPNILDNDGDQQIPTLGYFKDHLSDDGVEIIITPRAYDNTSDNQMPRAPWNIDYEEDREGVPFIIVNTGAIQGWDYEINQIQDKSWYIDIYEGTETLIPIKPTIIPVALIKRLGIVPRIVLLTDVHPRLAIQEVLISAQISITLFVTPSVSQKSLITTSRLTIKFASDPGV